VGFEYRTLSVRHRINNILDLFLRNSLPHCHDGCPKIFKLIERVQVQAILHQPPDVLNWVQVWTISWVIMQLDSLALQVFPYYFSGVATRTILHELKSVPPEDGNDVRLENILIQDCILSLVYFINMQLSPSVETSCHNEPTGVGQPWKRTLTRLCTLSYASIGESCFCVCEPIEVSYQHFSLK